jgi:hypothetical protein
MKRILGLLCVTLIIGSVAYAAEPVFKAEIDTNGTLIGKQIELRLSAEYDKNHTVFWPEIKDSIGSLEIVNIAKPDTVKKEANLSVIKKYKITSFDAGDFTIPEFTFSYQKQADDNLFAAQTKEINLKFAGIEVDTTKDIKDIKPPLVPPYQFDWMIVLYIVLGILAVFVAWYVWKRYFAGKKDDLPKAPIRPDIPAHILALESLKRLDEEKLWQNGQEKLYHVKLSEIIRTYIAAKFDIDAIEMTSSEILEYFGGITNMSPELKESIRKQFNISDMTKFAKYRPLPDEHGFCLRSAIEFVEKTHATFATPANNEEVK